MPVQEHACTLQLQDLVLLAGTAITDTAQI